MKGDLIVVEIVRKDGTAFVAHVIVSLSDNPEGEQVAYGAAAFHSPAYAKKVEKYLRSAQFKTRRVIYRKVSR